MVLHINTVFESNQLIILSFTSLNDVIQGYLLVVWVFIISVFQEGVVSEHNGLLKLAAHREGVPHHSPLQSTHVSH